MNQIVIIFYVVINVGRLLKMFVNVINIFVVFHAMNQYLIQTMLLDIIILLKVLLKIYLWQHQNLSKMK